jgi:hypothetical protein
MSRIAHSASLRVAAAVRQPVGMIEVLRCPYDGFEVICCAVTSAMPCYCGPLGFPASSGTASMRCSGFKAEIVNGIKPNGSEIAEPFE